MKVLSEYSVPLADISNRFYGIWSSLSIGKDEDAPVLN